MMYVVALLACCSWAVSSRADTQASQPREEVRALWIPAPSTPLTSPEDAELMIREARKARFNTLIIQVRALGDAYYQSRIVPMALGVPARYPDPLKWILEKAKETNANSKDESPLRVYIALEMLRGHSMRMSSRPPAGNIVSRHRDWVTLNAQNKSITKDSFLCLEPGLESVREYLSEVVREVVGDYEVDGVFLDGLRYPDASGDWGYHQDVLNNFRKRHSGASDRPRADDPLWMEFRQEQLRILALELVKAVRETRPGCKVILGVECEGTAPMELEDWKDNAVYKGMMQDWVRWGREGIGDLLCVRNFQRQATSGDVFQNWNAFASRAGVQCGILVGIAGGLNFNTGISNQLRAVRNAGFAGIVLFDYQRPTIEDRQVLMNHLRNMFAVEALRIQLMNIEYIAPKPPGVVDAALTTPTLALALTTPTLALPADATPEADVDELAGLDTGVLISEVEVSATPEEMAAEPTPSPTPSLLLATRTPEPQVFETFRLRNGMSFKARILVEIDEMVTLVTEDGTQLKIPRAQIVQPRSGTQP
jgi:uncharacterized lipoprotein YddW (UPF0748 family)